jgi:predicted component of type VI protein secretion system
MSNWDRLAVMELFEAIQRAKLEAQTTEVQRTQLEALVQRHGHKAKTIDVRSEDVRALRNALCQICNLGVRCLFDANQCSKAQEIG